jgi:sialate O-acetylesterase
MDKGLWAAAAAASVVIATGCSSLTLYGAKPPTPPAPAIVKPETTFPPKPLTLLYTTFQDHAVLQRDKPIPVWGKTKPGAMVTVTLGSETANGAADASGHWQVTLTALKAGGPYMLTAKSDAGEAQAIKDVLIGDVYLCSGQSNMEMPVRVASGYDAAFYGPMNPNLRLFHVQRFTSPMPRPTFGADASWTITSPSTFREFSAACYYFGRALQPYARVPVGLIEDSWGGSVIQDWISMDAMRSLGGYDRLLDLLPVYAVSRKAGEQKWREIAHAWWVAHDPASSASPSWHDPAYDDSAWGRIVPTGTWREWGVPALKTFNGVVWLRENVELSAKQAQGAAVLSLGAIDQTDTTWVNGVAVGDLQGYDVKRVYDMPAGTLHEGRNLIAVGVFGGAGPLAPANEMVLKLADGSVVPLTNPWRYKTSAPMSQTGHIPDIPWLNQFGLSTLYNGMILPLGPTQIRAVLWYQGESDAWQPVEYARLLPTLITDWRKLFGADVPFMIVQLPGYGPYGTVPEQSDWASLREVQRRVADATSNTGLAVTIDLGQTDNIHPTDKEEVGQRLALLARKLVYGEDVTDSGPTPLNAIRIGATVQLTFAHTEKGLTVYESNRPISFQLCDAARRCTFVDAVQKANEIDLDASHVKDVAFVRFCWADSPICNLYNTAGLPAVPFEIPVTDAGEGKKLSRKSR